MDTKMLAAALVGFMLGGLTVSIAAEIEGDVPDRPSHSIEAPALSSR